MNQTIRHAKARDNSQNLYIYLYQSEKLEGESEKTKISKE